MKDIYDGSFVMALADVDAKRAGFHDWLTSKLLSKPRDPPATFDDALFPITTGLTDTAVSDNELVPHIRSCMEVFMFLAVTKGKHDWLDNEATCQTEVSRDLLQKSIEPGKFAVVQGATLTPTAINRAAELAKIRAAFERLQNVFALK